MSVMCERVWREIRVAGLLGFVPRPEVDLGMGLAHLIIVDTLPPPPTPTHTQGTAVQTTMPKLKPLTQELPKPSQPTAPVPASGKSPTPAMPQLKKIATGAPQPTPLTAGTMKNSPLVAKQPSETQVPQLHAAKSNK